MKRILLPLTSGYDSTAYLLKNLEIGNHVFPIYINIQSSNKLKSDQESARVIWMVDYLRDNYPQYTDLLRYPESDVSPYLELSETGRNGAGNEIKYNVDLCCSQLYHIQFLNVATIAYQYALILQCDEIHLEFPTNFLNYSDQKMNDFYNMFIRDEGIHYFNENTGINRDRPFLSCRKSVKPIFSNPFKNMGELSKAYHYLYIRGFDKRIYDACFSCQFPTLDEQTKKIMVCRTCISCNNVIVYREIDNWDIINELINYSNPDSIVNLTYEGEQLEFNFEKKEII